MNHDSAEFDEPLVFHENGNLKSGQLWKSTPLKDREGEVHLFQQFTRVYFDDEGYVIVPEQDF